jgi:hypothetical protein
MIVLGLFSCGRLIAKAKHYGFTCDTKNFSRIKSTYKLRTEYPGVYNHIHERFVRSFIRVNNALPQPTTLRRFWAPKTLAVNRAYRLALQKAEFTSTKKSEIEKNLDIDEQATKAWTSFESIQAGFKAIDAKIEVSKTTDIRILVIFS